MPRLFDACVSHVEPLLGFARRKFLVPVPQVDSLTTLNRQLIEGCQRDLEERTWGKPATKQELLPDDQAAFLPLPKGAFEARRITEGTANSESLVRFGTNDYSVPVQYAHRKLLTVATVDEVRLVYEDRLVARQPHGVVRVRTLSPRKQKTPWKTTGCCMVRIVASPCQITKCPR